MNFNKHNPFWSLQRVLQYTLVQDAQSFEWSCKYMWMSTKNQNTHQNLLGSSYPKYCHMRDLGCINWLYIFFLLFLASDLEIYKKNKAKNKKMFAISWKFSSISIEKKEEAELWNKVNNSFGCSFFCIYSMSSFSAMNYYLQYWALSSGLRIVSEVYLII